MSDEFATKLKEIREERSLSQEELAALLGTSKQVISRYETNQRTPKITIAKDYADKLNVDLNYLLGIEEKELDIFSIPGIIPITTKKIPLLGEISCGVPSYADQDFNGYIEVGADIKADFALKAKGDSMTGAFIRDGDIVFIREQPMVENGDIAVVIIDDEATLKRFTQQGDIVVLNAENPSYKPIIINITEDHGVRILGKAIAFHSDVR